MQCLLMQIKFKCSQIMALNLLAFYLSFPYIYGGGESEKDGGKSHGGSLYSFLVENCWSFVNHYKVKKWWFYNLWIFQIVGSVGISRKKRWWCFLSKISMLQIGGKSYVPSEIRLIVRSPKVRIITELTKVPNFAQR